ncbi:MAG: hypothetical protein ICV60_24445, partial [Pyrinomonadaceae bacterium]|nr:hypothetical protein [Pyrinomonadaceae bacterium]
MATEIAKEKTDFRAMFQALQERQSGAAAPSFARLRESAMKRFEQLGVPTTDHEEWKYTNVAPLARLPFALPSRETTLDLDANRLAPFI